MWKLIRLMLSLPLCEMLLLGAPLPALALDINLTFNLSGSSSVTDFGANTNSFTSAVAYAAQQLDNAITDPITVNITVNGAPGTSTFGASSTVPYGPYTYTQVLNALTTNATQPAQQIAVANLPSNDPSLGGPNNYYVPNGEAKALGLLSATNSANDGSVTFGAGNAWAFDPNNRAVQGETDFIGIAFHELTEVLGRTWGLGNGNDGRGYYVPLDLFRFDGGTTTRDMTNNTNVWFSINGGKTDLNSFNYAFTNSSGTDTEDPTDWGIGVANANYQSSLTNDAFNAYSAGGVVNALSSADLTLLNAMGYHLSAAAMSGGFWARNGNGSWTTASYWNYPIVPSGGTTTVYFAGVPVGPSAPITVTLDGNQSAGALQFSVTNGNGYTLAQGSGGTLSLGSQSVGAITVIAGSHAISAPVTLEGPLTVNVAAGSALQLSGPIGEANGGTSLTFNGPGTLNYSSVGRFTGNTNVNGGMLQVTGGLLPASSEYVGGTGGASATVTLSAGVNAVSNTLTLGVNAGASGVYLLSSGSLSAVSETIGSLGSGSFVQSGGTNSASSSVLISNSGAGAYAMNGGLLNTAELEVGVIGPTAGGTFTQTNGTVHASGGGQAGLVLDSSPGYPVATYSESGGQLTVIAELVGYYGTGSFIQSGGTHNVSGGLVVGGLTNLSGGTYSLQGGKLSTDAETIGNLGTGSFTQSGGTNTDSGSFNLGYGTQSSGTYSLSSGALTLSGNLNVGNSGSGTFLQTGGSVSVTGNKFLQLGLAIGGSGSYSISAGSLAALTEYIGYAGSGSFTQTGGTNAVSNNLTLGYLNGASGSYNLMGGVLSAGELIGVSGGGAFTQSGGSNSATLEYVGEETSGSYMQSGGTNSLPGYNLYVGLFGTGSYNLSGGGQLSAGYEGTGYSASGSFMQSGGSNAATNEDIGIGANNTPATGSYTQTGGTHAVQQTLTLGIYAGGFGTYNLSGNGQLTAVTELIGQSGTGSFTQSGGNNTASSLLFVGYGSGSGSYSLSGSGVLSVLGNEYIGYSGSGSFAQTGGTNSTSQSSGLYLGYIGGVSGSYNLSGNGVLSMPFETFGFHGTGSFTQSGGINAVTGPAQAETIGGFSSGSYTQSGGTNSVAYQLIVGSLAGGTGSYALSGSGLLAAAYEYVGDGGSGSFTQTGGVNSASGETIGAFAAGSYTQSGGTDSASGVSLGASAVFLNYPGGNGTYTLSGSGLLSTSYESIGGSGTGSFTQTGGSHSVSTEMDIGYFAGAIGSYSLSGSGQLFAVTENVGNPGSGSFTQTGGNHLVYFLSLGYSASGYGSYNLVDGPLAGYHEYIGNSGSGSFTQTGGTNSVPLELDLGYGSSGCGSYNLSGSGLLSVPNYENIGYSGTGCFTQSGGTHAVYSLTLGLNPGSAGAYSLQGGLLNIASLSQGGGSATFNFSGGTFQAAQDLSTTVPFTLNVAGSNGVFDTNGHSLTLAGPISGPGGLIVAGSGSLTLGVSNNYTGTTLVSNGTLMLADSNALSGSTFDSSGNGVLSFGSMIGAFNFGGLQGSGSLALTDASGVDVALTVGGNNASTTFSGDLSDGSGGGRLTMAGTGALVLSGTNTYGGGTIVLDGTLIVTNNEGLAEGSSLYVGDPSLFGTVLPGAVTGDSKAVPEPGTLALLMASVALMVLYRKLC
jgi:autotransporter-associated beta strand protein